MKGKAGVRGVESTETSSLSLERCGPVLITPQKRLVGTAERGTNPPLPHRKLHISFLTLVLRLTFELVP